MFDTNVAIVGNVLTAPQWRRTSKTNSLVASFKVASTARRLDRENGCWVDGNSLRVRVSCWRRLAEGVAASVMVGDPIVVVGKLYTRDWIDTEGNHRTLYEVEAIAVGHDLARGRGRFARNKPTLATSTVEDADAESRVRGELAEVVPPEEAPARPGELFDDPDGDFIDGLVPPEPGTDELTALRGGGFVTTGGLGVRAGAGGPDGLGPDGLGPDGHGSHGHGPDGSEPVDDHALRPPATAAQDADLDVSDEAPGAWARDAVPA